MEGVQVAVFRYETVVGCRRTTSSQHSQLPIPGRRHRAIEGFTSEPRFRVGFEFLYGYAHDYAVVDGKVKVEHCLPTSQIEHRSENERTYILVEQLTRFSRGRLSIRAFGNNRDHFCAFSGGGDAQMFGSVGTTAAVLSTETGESDEEDVPPPCPTNDANLTPPKQGENQCGSLENKVSGQQSEEDATLQLQADMVLTSTTLLLSKMKAVTTQAELQIMNTLSCYGLLMGPSYSLKLLKLSIDFNKQTLVFEELFKLSPCLLYPVYVDIAIDHMFKLLESS